MNLHNYTFLECVPDINQAVIPDINQYMAVTVEEGQNDG